ncbi:MAG: PEP-CTERM system TPR-repeat protein PrsT [Gammaproteobacteria bacterium]
MTRGNRRNFSYHWCCRVLLIIGLLVPCHVFSAAATAQNYLAEARTLMDKGEYDAAVIQLKNVLLLEPDNAGAHLLLGNAFIESRDAASAEKEISRARELGMDAVNWKVPLGRAYLLSGKHDKLLREVTLEEQFPAAVRADILQLHGQAFLAKRQFPEADDNFRAVLALQPERSEALLGRARIAYYQQQRNKAAELIDEVLQRDPRSAEAWMMRGGLLSNSGDHQGASKAYQRALEIDPQMSAARAAKATAHTTLGEYDAALREIETIRSDYANSYLANYLAALVYFQKQDLNQALTFIHDALGIAPDHLPSQLLAGSIYYRKGQYRQAEEYLRPYWNANPGDARTAKLLAISLVKTGRQQAAIEVLEKSLQANPDEAQLLAILGSLLTRTGQADKGLEYLERAAEAAPESAAILTELAIGHLVSGDTGQAVTELQGAVELDDDVVQADMLLVLMQLRKGKTGEALRSARQFAEKYPENVIARNLLGRACLAVRDYPSARAAFEKALALDAASVPARMGLADIDLQQGHRESAKQHYRAVLKQDEGNLQASLAMAKLAFQQGQKEAAKHYLLKARSRHPEDIKSALLLSELYRQEQDAGRALELARSAAASQPRNPGVLKVLARAQLEAGDIEGGIATLETLAGVVPSAAPVHYRIAQLYLQLKNAAAARNSLERAIDLQQDYPVAQATLGRLEIVEKDYAAAEKIARALQQTHPRAADGYQLEGDLLAAQGQFRAAVAAYEKAYGLEASARLAMNIFNMRNLTGEGEQAAAALQAWLNNHPQDNDTRMALAGYLQQQGRLDEATTEYLAILGQDPDNLNALYSVAWLYQRQGSDKGVAYAEQAYELAPQRPEIIDTLGWLLVQNGNQQRGLVLLQEAVSSAPDRLEMRYHMAVALAEVGRRDEARRELMWILEQDKDFSKAAETRALLDKLETY